MIPGCLVPAVTLGFDSAMMNGLQVAETWIACMPPRNPSLMQRQKVRLRLTEYIDFDSPSGSILGFMTTILSVQHHLSVLWAIDLVDAGVSGLGQLSCLLEVIFKAHPYIVGSSLRSISLWDFC
jgi:hypothetical protein